MRRAAFVALVLALASCAGLSRQERGPVERTADAPSASRGTGQAAPGTSRGGSRVRLRDPDWAWVPSHDLDPAGLAQSVEERPQAPECPALGFAWEWQGARLFPASRWECVELEGVRASQRRDTCRSGPFC
jgi:hypothetical protein